MSSWVLERRLRPIYEMLDAGSNKGVITLVDRLLKKQSDFSCAKVLKALALIRMNKKDEARVLLEPVANEAPTDDGTIQALSICYRELDEPVRLCRILEAACEKEKSEELLTHCFMSLVRIRDYSKMYGISLQLYKLYSRGTYYGWVIVSLLLKYDNSVKVSETPDTISLELAVRMMSKYFVDQKGHLDDNMLELYMLVLSRKQDWETALDVLRKCGYPQPNWRNDESHVAYCLALEHVGSLDELFDYLKSAYLKNPDEFILLKQMIDVFGKTDVDRIDAFLKDLMEHSVNRTVVLADMYFAVNCIEDLPCEQERITRDLHIAFPYCFDKLSFHADIVNYFKIIPGDAQYEILTKVLPAPVEGGTFNSISKIIKDVNFDILCREYHERNDEQLNRLHHANVCFGKYMICNNMMHGLRSDDNLISKEANYHDQYLVIAVVNILSELCKCPSMEKEGWNLETHLMSYPWTELNESHAPELHALINQLRSDLAEEQRTNDSALSTNDLADDLKQLELDTRQGEAYFEDKEALLLYAICVLEYGLEKSPYNYSMRILLTNAYTRVGAVSQAIKVVQGLDLKHVQWDTLGYLIIPHALTSGTYAEGAKMLNAADTLYSTYRRESMEHVIAAYKYGSFGKIDEFMTFRDQLLSSTQCGMTYVEKRLLELMLCFGTTQDLVKCADNINLVTILEWFQTPQFTDNRDFSVIEFFDEIVDADFYREMSADQDYYFLKMRMTILYILVTFIRYHAGVELSAMRTQLKDVVQTFSQHQKLWTDIYNDKVKGKELVIPHLFGIYPPRTGRYFLMSASTHLMEIMELLMELMVQNDRPLLGIFQTKIEDTCSALLEIMKENQATFLETKRLTDVDRFIVDGHYALETFSFIRIMVEVSITTFKVRQDSSGKPKGKQKEKASQTFFKRNIGSLVGATLAKCIELHECFNRFIDVLKEQPLPCLNLMKSSMRDLLTKSFLFSAFGRNFDIAQVNIHDSHLNQLEEMRKVSASIIDYIRNNMESLGK